MLKWTGKEKHPPAVPAGAAGSSACSKLIIVGIALLLQIVSGATGTTRLPGLCCGSRYTCYQAGPKLLGLDAVYGTNSVPL